MKVVPLFRQLVQVFPIGARNNSTRQSGRPDRQLFIYR